MMDDIQQGTDAWLIQRLGKVTASRVADVIAKTKSGYSASRANYMAQLVSERLTGQIQETYVNDAMRHGIVTEDQARAAYEYKTGLIIQQVGFVPHPSIEMSGASPDGYAGDDGLIEIKCPTVATHIETLRSGKVPDKYIVQMMWQMAATGRGWCDYISFQPYLPERMRLFVSRVHRDDKRIDELESEVIGFLAEVDETIKDLTRKYPEAA